jgi:hypothetical protein
MAKKNKVAKKVFPIGFLTKNKKTRDDYLEISARIKKRGIEISDAVPAFLVEALKDDEKNGFEKLKRHI